MSFPLRCRIDAEFVPWCFCSDQENPKNQLQKKQMPRLRSNARSRSLWSPAWPTKLAALKTRHAARACRHVPQMFSGTPIPTARENFFGARGKPLRSSTLKRLNSVPKK